METMFSSTHNRPVVIGLVLLAFPILFWIAVISEQFFNNGFLQENLIMKIDHLSSILSILLFIIFPLIALMINLFSISRFNVSRENDKWITVFGICAHAANFAIIIFSLRNILILFGYSITENFIVTPR